MCAVLRCDTILSPAVVLVTWLTVALCWSHSAIGAYVQEPTFDVPLVNVTVVAGQSIVLQCSIDHLGKYKVAWLDQNHFPLTLEDHRVIDDPRFSVVRPHLKEWNLLISEVKRSDSGPYRCTVNTEPIRSKIVMLHVKVPPQIIIDPSVQGSDVIVREGDTIRLTCNVTGIPHPTVTWFRRSTDPRVPTENLGGGGSGETVTIVNVSRYLGDLYECMASNGVPPAVNRQIRVIVQYAPEIVLPNRRISQKRGGEVVLECVVRAVPLASHYWVRNNGASAAVLGSRSMHAPIASSDKHVTEEYEEPDGSITLRLNIRNIQPADYGVYSCVATNVLGRVEQNITVYEYRDPAQTQSLSDRSVAGRQSSWPNGQLLTSKTTTHQPILAAATYRPRALVINDQLKQQHDQRRQQQIEARNNNNNAYKVMVGRGVAGHSLFHVNLAQQYVIVLTTAAVTVTVTRSFISHFKCD